MSILYHLTSLFWNSDLKYIIMHKQSFRISFSNFTVQHSFRPFTCHLTDVNTPLFRTHDKKFIFVISSFLRSKLSYDYHLPTASFSLRLEPLHDTFPLFAPPSSQNFRTFQTTQLRQFSVFLNRSKTSYWSSLSVDTWKENKLKVK